MSLILGIETSCDETAAAVVEVGRVVRSNIIASQHHLHERYRGVVPEIASRAHLQRIAPVIREALDEAGVTFADLDAVAVGNRPGLIGSLMVGLSAAKAIAWSTGKPLIGVDHVRAHLYAANLLLAKPGPPAPPPTQARSRTKDTGPGTRDTGHKNDTGHGTRDTGHKSGTRDTGQIAYPALGLVVSGGHTSLYHVASPTELMLIGRTIDDAVGEAYDKAAVILDLGYPGGPALDKLAQQGDAKAYKLPRSLLDEDSLDFSFSGLKTALLYTVRGQPRGRGDAVTFERSAVDLTDTERADLAASFQAAAIDAIMIKLGRALLRMDEQDRRPRSLVIGGGVSANSLLRARTLAFGEEHHIPVHLPAMSLCLDNAAMIAGLAHHSFTEGHVDDLTLPAIATTGR